MGVIDTAWNYELSKNARSNPRKAKVRIHAVFTVSIDLSTSSNECVCVHHHQKTCLWGLKVFHLSLNSLPPALLIRRQRLVAVVSGRLSVTISRGIHQSYCSTRLTSWHIDGSLNFIALTETSSGNSVWDSSLFAQRKKYCSSVWLPSITFRWKPGQPRNLHEHIQGTPE